MFDKLKRKLFGAVYNGPETPAYPEKQAFEPVNSPNDPNMGFVYAGPDPFVRLDGPAYPENQTMGIMTPVEEPALPVYAGPKPFGGEDPKYIPPTMGLPAPPPPYRGYIRLDHPQYRQQLDLTRDRELRIGRIGWEFPIPKEMQPTVSREHCTISYNSWKDFFTVVDLHSTNGVLSREMVWQNETVYVIGDQAFNAVAEILGIAASGHQWQQVGHRLPAGTPVYVSPGTALRIGTMPITLWSEKNYEPWG